MLAMGSKLEKVHSVCDVRREEVRGGGYRTYCCRPFLRCLEEEEEGGRLFVSWEFKKDNQNRER